MNNMAVQSTLKNLFLNVQNVYALMQKDLGIVSKTFMQTLQMKQCDFEKDRILPSFYSSS